MHSTQEAQLRLLRSGAPIVALFGQTGAGKSTFINLIVSEVDRQGVGHSLHSCTDTVTAIGATVRGKKITINDSPGFDDTTGLSDADILDEIADLLKQTGTQGIFLTGIVFLHRIFDVRYPPIADRVVRMLAVLCGPAAFKHVILCTTQWDRAVITEEAEKREAELFGMPGWKEMIAGGATTARHSSTAYNGKINAEQLLLDLISRQNPIKLAIQYDMLDDGMKVCDTMAGQIVAEHYLKERKKMEEKMRVLEQQAAEMQGELMVLQKQMEHFVKQSSEERKELQDRINVLQTQMKENEKDKKWYEARIETLSEKLAENIEVLSKLGQSKSSCTIF